jgi:hypothetical protein
MGLALTSFEKLLVTISIVLLCMVLSGCGQGYEASRGESSSTEDATSTPAPTPTPTPGMKTVFMASGHMGRTVMSCDGGLTWINDRSDNNNARCWVNGPNYVECDHTAYSGRGIDSHGGWFVANFGWGVPGSVRRSRDGINWETVRTGEAGGGVTIYNGALVVAWGGWWRSTNLGMTWTAVANTPAFELSHPLFQRVNDKTFAAGRANGIAFTKDQGATWTRVTNFPADRMTYFAEGNGVLLSLGNGGTGNLARSLNDGITWDSLQVTTGANRSWAGLVFNGTHFVTWAGGQMFRSADGSTWTATPMTFSGGFDPSLFNGPVQYNPETRTYVAIPNNWGRYYTGQRALHSSDGYTWTQLSGAAFTGGHPINHITAGPMEAANCP